MGLYVIVDPSSKVNLYDDALYDAMSEVRHDCDIKLLYSGRGLLKLVPTKYESSRSTLKRLLKVLECILNYMYVGLLVLTRKPQIVHFQWLPFLEVCNIETYIFKIMKHFSNKTKFILTIHNLYPHNLNANDKVAYNNRFKRISLLFDAYIVHTNVTKQDVVREFDIDNNKIFVCHHGVFAPNTTIDKVVPKEPFLTILQFGSHSFYKGTDILIKAVSSLPKNYRTKIKVRIVGGINSQFYEDLREIDKNNTVLWKPYFLSDNDLYKEIKNADIIVLPYRAISQSGVLLLSLFFEKLIITSNLPSFVETLSSENEEINKSIFFESENENQLEQLIRRYVDGQVNTNLIYEHLMNLKNSYSWKSAAIKTFEIYHIIIGVNQYNHNEI